MGEPIRRRFSKRAAVVLIGALAALGLLAPAGALARTPKEGAKRPAWDATKVRAGGEGVNAGLRYRSARVDRRTGQEVRGLAQLGPGVEEAYLALSKSGATPKTRAKNKGRAQALLQGVAPVTWIPVQSSVRTGIKEEIAHLKADVAQQDLATPKGALHAVAALATSDKQLNDLAWKAESSRFTTAERRHLARFTALVQKKVPLSVAQALAFQLGGDYKQRDNVEALYRYTGLGEAPALVLGPAEKHVARAIADFTGELQRYTAATPEARQVGGYTRLVRRAYRLERELGHIEDVLDRAQFKDETANARRRELSSGAAMLKHLVMSAPSQIDRREKNGSAVAEQAQEILADIQRYAPPSLPAAH